MNDPTTEHAELERFENQEPYYCTLDDITIHADGTADLPLPFLILFGPEGTVLIKEHEIPVRIRMLNGPFDLRTEMLRVEPCD